MIITHPAPDSKEYADLPLDVRDDVRRWVWTINNNPPTKPIKLWFQSIATILGVSASTVKTKYYTVKKTGAWQSLADGRKGKKESLTCRTNDSNFQAYFKKLCEANQRSTEAAIRQLKREWKSRQIIPAYEDFPDYPAIPSGWSARNLRRLAPSKLELSTMRFGVKTAAKHLPQIYSTRVGLWPAAFYQFDDVWHDNYVRAGKQTTRVLELGCLDVLSGCRFAFGAKPRLKREDGTKTNLNEAEMRMFLANVLYNHGVHPILGTTLVIENGTATVRGDVENILADLGQRPDGSPLIQISRSGIQGKQQAVLNLWGGRGGGNPRHKASLESLHNLIHNELAALTAQTGHDRNEPEMSHGIVKYQEQLLKGLDKITPERRALLQHPVLDFHSQFLPLLSDVYEHAINGRIDHQLEGWSQLGHILTEYTIMPNSGQWLRLEQLPEASRAIITSAAASAPDQWSQTRNLSPMEVWNTGKTQLQPVPAHIICDILGKDLAVERKIRGASIEFQDRDISPETLRYESRIQTIDGRRVELKQGEIYLTFSNPYAPEQLFVCDADYRCLGIAPRVKRVCAADTAEVYAAYGDRNQRKAEILTPLRDRWQPEVTATNKMREHNKRLRSGELVTEEERRSEGAHKAVTTKRINKAPDTTEEELASLLDSEPTQITDSPINFEDIEQLLD